MKALFLSLALAALSLTAAHANDSNFMDDFDPTAPGASDVLKAYEEAYESETGQSVDTSGDFQNLVQNAGPGCKRMSCRIFVHIKKSQQRMYVYVDGVLRATWKTSTGMAGYTTPNFDTRPDGRIYTAYTSTKYPGGNYNGLGNMPYAVFIRGGYAIHGTGTGNWKRLGSPASHGCIRIHPTQAAEFNKAVRIVGVRNVWITVTD